MILKRIKTILIILIITSFIGSMLLFLGNLNNKNYEIDNQYLQN